MPFVSWVMNLGFAGGAQPDPPPSPELVVRSPTDFVRRPHEYVEDRLDLKSRPRLYPDSEPE